MIDRSEQPEVETPIATPWWRRPVDWVRRWLTSGGCSACKSHENDVDRWKRELAERRGEAPGESDHSR